MTATRAVRRQSTPVAAGTSSVAAAASNPSFAALGVPAALVKALAAAGISEPFPIQAATLPDSLAGRDVLGRGRTGSGKTYAFLLPLLAGSPRSRAARRPAAPRADPGADPRAGHPDRRRPRAARRSRWA